MSLGMRFNAPKLNFNKYIVINYDMLSVGVTETCEGYKLCTSESD